jgi:hypothetical protein
VFHLVRDNMRRDSGLGGRLGEVAAQTGRTTALGPWAAGVRIPVGWRAREYGRIVCAPASVCPPG